MVVFSGAGRLLRLGALGIWAAVAWTQSADAPREYVDLRQDPPPRAVYRLDRALSPPSDEDAEAVARRFLGGSVAARVAQGYELRLSSRIESAQGALTHLGFQPVLSGLEIYGAELRAHVDSQGRLIRIEESALPSLPRVSEEMLTAEEAVRAAITAIDPTIRPRFDVLKESPEPERRTVLASASLAAPAHARRVWFPLQGEARPAWRLYLALDPKRAYEAVVDAGSGETLFRFPLVREQAPSGSVFSAPAVASPAEGSRSTEPLTGWPAASGVCPSDVYPTQFSPGGALDGLCWGDGAETVGANADACLDTAGDNVCAGRAASVSSSFNPPFTNSYSVSNDPVPDRDAALVNAFYWTNAAHDWLYRLGFDEAAGAFQQDNYGRGGAAGDAVHVDVQDATTNSSATFLTPPDGIAPRLQLGLFTGVHRDSAFDGDVIVHEYVHGLSARLVGGPSNVSGLFLWHSGAMNEGWSDALAVSFTSDPVFAEYVANNFSTGIRTVRYDASPLTFGDFGLRGAAVIPGTGGLLLRLPQVHRDGEIWASVLWDLRQALGKDDMERLVTAALSLTSPRPSMLDGRDAIVQAAQALSLGGANACAVWSAFAGRGMGASAALNLIESAQPNDTALSVFESFDAPAVCGGTPPTVGAVLLSDGAEADAGWTASGLWHRSTRRAVSGSSSWWYGQESTGSYETGTRTSGELVSPTIDLSGAAGAILEWDQLLRGEGFFSRIELGSLFSPYLNADSGRVEVSTDGGSNWTTLTHIAHDTPGAGFAHFRINLSDYAGSSIRLRFAFDTYNASANGQEGWFLDNITVSTLSSGPALAASPGTIEVVGVSGGGAGQQSISISNGGTGSLSWTASVTQGSSWLSVSPASGSAPATLTATASPAALAQGIFNGGILIDAGPAGVRTVAVTFTVTAPLAAAARWSFEESASGPGVAIVDSTGSGHNGVSAGKGTAPVAGVFGSARIFNGFSDSVGVPGSAALSPQRFTVRAWVKLNRYPGNVGAVVSNFSGASYRGWYLAITSAGKAVFLAATPPASAPWLVSNSTLELGRWHMLTATFDRSSGNAYLYVDGVLDASAVFPGLTPEIAGPLTLGKASWFDTYFLDAALDEIEIFPEIRGGDEIAADFAAFSPPPPVADTDVGGDWPFNASGADESGNGHDPIEYGGSSVSGVSGQARRFDGIDDVVRMPADELLEPASFTVRAWVRLLASPSPWGAMISNYDANFSGWYVGVTGSGQAFFAVGAKPSSLPSALSHSALIIGRWHHLAAVYDGRTQRISLYVDGELHGSRFVSGMTPRTSGEILMGRASWTDAHYTNFDLDEPRVEPRAWTASQIASDFAAFPLQPKPPPLAVWDFDETDIGPGTTFADSSGNGHDATTVANRNLPLSGIDGAARSFGGWPDAAQIAADPDFSTSSFSFSTWIRLDEYPESWGVIASTYDGAFRGWYGGVSSDGRVIFSVSGLPSSNPWLLSTSSLELGRWHHLALTFEGATRRGLIYINGVRDASAVFPAWTPQTGVSPTLGRASWVNSVYLKQMLDGARLYSYERTESEVAADHASFAAQSNPIPLAVWELDEPGVGAGLTLSDGGGEHDWTMQGLGLAAAGIDGAARGFDGVSDYATMADSAALRPAAFTWTGWVRLDAQPNGFAVLYSDYDGAFRGWYAGVYNDGRLILSVSGLPSSNPWLLSTSALTPGQWRHLAFSFDTVSGRGAIYVDGLLDATAVFPVYTPSGGTAPALGRASWADLYYARFTIDRSRLYSTELSGPQVATEAQTGAP